MIQFTANPIAIHDESQDQPLSQPQQMLNPATPLPTRHNSNPLNGITAMAAKYANQPTPSLRPSVSIDLASCGKLLSELVVDLVKDPEWEDL